MNLFPRKIVGIDFHDYSAELVELKEQGKSVSLEAYNRELIPPNIIKGGEIVKEKELKKILLKLLRNSNPKPVEAKNVAVIFPPSKVLTHIFDFPAALNDTEINKAIPYEAEKVIPFSINDVYWDFAVIEKEKKKEKQASQKVLFACISKTIADQYVNVLESIGLTPALFSIHAETLKHAMAGHLLSDKATLIIDVGVLSVNYLVIKDKQLKYYFSSNESGKKLLTDIASELQVQENAIFEKKEKNKLENIGKIPQIKTFIEKCYQKGQEIIQEQEKQKIENVILTGEFINLPDFYKTAKIYFPNQELLIGDPKLCLSIDDKKFNPEEKGDKIAVPYSTYFTNAIGIALRGLNKYFEDGINLIPDRLKENFTGKKNSLLLSVFSISMAVISLLIGTFMFFKLQSLNYERLNLEIQKNAVTNMIYGTRYMEIRDEIVKFNNEIKVLSEIDNGLFSVPNTLEKIEDLIPDDIEISSINFNSEDLSISINGIASTRKKILEAKRNFEEATFISEVVAPISNYDEKTKISFILELNLNLNKLDKYGASSNAN